MKNLLTIDLENQVLRCRVCKVEHEIPRRLLRDQDALLDMVDDKTADHKECAQTPDQPRKAKLCREFRKRVHRELQRENGREEVRRLTHTPFPTRREA